MRGQGRVTIESLQAGSVISGPILPEAVEVIAVVPLGDSVKIIGKGLKTNLVHQPVLTPEQIAQLQFAPTRQAFDGDGALFRLGIEAQRLGLAYEYDPYFSLSIARVDPLPHQLEAVVISVDPVALRAEIARLTALIEQARQLEARQVESKLNKLKAVLTEQGVFSNPRMKLLLFTEHKDTLDYLAGDGREG